MNLKETLYEIDRAMKHNSEYSGILPTHANALTTYGLLHNETVEARNPTRLRFGILENHAMISGVTRTGEDRLIMLAPAPTEIEEGAAILTSTGVVIAAYTNHLDDYESVAAWDTINLVEPKSREEIYLDLLVGPLDLRTGKSLSGVEIAARYLLETKTGLPLGLEPESI